MAVKCSGFVLLPVKEMGECEFAPGTSLKCSLFECGTCRPEKRICRKCHNVEDAHEACDKYDQPKSEMFQCDIDIAVITVIKAKHSKK